MVARKYLLCLCMFLALASKAVGDEAASSTPKAAQLESGWWDTYQNLDQETLHNSFSDLLESLRAEAASLPEENKKKALAALEKIAVNFQSYEKNRFIPLPPPPEPGVIAPSYSLGEVVNLYRAIRRQEFELESANTEIKAKKSQLAATQKKMAQAKIQYAESEDRSAKKLLTGIEIINLRSESALEELGITFLEQVIATKQASISHMEEELNTAVTRLAVSDLDLFLYAQQVKIKEDAWEAAQKALKEKESLEAENLNKSIDAEGDELHQELLQETEQAAIKEALAYTEYLFAQAQLALAQLISNPEALDLNELGKKSERWDNQLDLFKAKIRDWRLRLQKQLDRSGQALAPKGAQERRQAAETNTDAHQRIITLTQENLLLLQQLSSEIDDTRFILKYLDKNLSIKIGGGRRWMQQSWDLMISLLQSGDYWLKKEVFTVGKNSVTFMGILRFIIILIGTFWLSRLAMHTLLKVGKNRKGVKKSLLYRITRLCYYLLLVIGVLVALSSLGFDFSNFLLVAGALGVGLGFGLQSIFNNFLSGIIILFESHLKVGDFIELESGLRGEIREINVRSTVITDNDGIDVLVPNSEIINNKVLNWTLKVPYRRINVPFSTAYGVDKDLVAKIVAEAALKVPHTLIKIGVPEPVVRLTKLGDYGLEFELIVWVKEKLTKRSRATRSDYLWIIETTLRENHIEIPYPQLDLRMKK